MNDDRLWRVVEGDGEIIAAAIHDGHDLRPEVAAAIALDEAQRLLEEDPHTSAFTTVAPTRIVVRRSRFEMDLNRPRDLAVYRAPEHAWGLRVWAQHPPPADLVSRSLSQYDAFYELVADLLVRVAAAHGPFVVLDFHSYNHRRGGPGAPPGDPAANPEVNVGTGSLDHDRWGHIAKRFVADLGAQEVGGAPLDVRENVRFTGGHLSRWIHERFDGQGCCLAVEVKKTFMDEHTGDVDDDRLAALTDALAAATGGLLEELRR